MTKKESMAWLEAEFAKHSMLARSNPRSLNELCYVLRMSKLDFAISWPTPGGFTSIPSVQETFIPSWQLAQKIEVVDYEEEYIGGKTYPCIELRIVDKED